MKPPHCFMLRSGKECRPAMKPVGYEAGGTDEVPFTSALRNASYFCRGSAWVPPRWSRGLESNQLPPAYEAGKRPVLFPGKLDPPAGFAPASPRYQRGASLSTLWRILKCSGTSEVVEGANGGRQSGRDRAAPSISPIRTARIAVFLVPVLKTWSHRESHPGPRNAIAPSCY